MKKTFLVSSIAMFAMIATAGQPVQWNAVFTNDVPAIAAAANPATTAIPSCNFTNTSGSSQTPLDLGFQTQWTLWAKATGVVAGTTTTNGTLTFSTIVSPDKNIWSPGPSMVLTFAPEALTPSAVSNYSCTTYRYVVFTNTVMAVTNVFATNSAIQLTPFWKSP